MTIDNPYVPPSPSEPPRQLEYRHIPAIILFVVSGVWILVSVLMIGDMMPFFPFHHSPLSGRRMFGCVLFVVAGTIWIIAGRYWLVRSWWRAILFTVAGYLLGAIAASLAFPQVP